MYNGLIQMSNNIYRAVIYIRLSEADEGKSYESESESITNQRNLLMNFVKEKDLYLLENMLMTDILVLILKDLGLLK